MNRPSSHSHTLVDLSHTVADGLVTYQGLPAPIICDYLSREDSRAIYSPGTEFQIGKIDMVANTGTYIDSPFHRYADGDDLSELELDSLANLDGQVVRVDRGSERAIGTMNVDGLDVRGKAVLFCTGWSQYWASDRYFENHPYLTEATARYLAESGATLVGIDSLNIDDRDDLRRPVHTILLGHGIPIVEHMTNLAELPDTGFRFFAVPVKVKGLGSFPVRAFARIDG